MNEFQVYFWENEYGDSECRVVYAEEFKELLKAGMKVDRVDLDSDDNVIYMVENHPKRESV